MFSAAQWPACSATDPSCGKRPSVRPGDVREVADDEDPRMILDGEVVPHVDPPAAPLLQPDGVRERRGLDPAAPDDTARRDRVAVGEHDVICRDLLDGRAEPDLDAAVGERLRRVGVRLRRERPEHGLARIDDDHPAVRRREAREPRRQHLADEVGERARDFRAGRAGPDDHERQLRPAPPASGRARRPRTTRGSGLAQPSRVVE